MRKRFGLPSRALVAAAALLLAAVGGWIAALATSAPAPLVAIGAVFSLLIVTAAIVLLVQMCALVRAARSAADRAANGDPGFRMSPPRGLCLLDEADRLAASFNHMLSQFEDAAERARQGATRDSLTGCYSHRYFHERLQQEIQRAERYDHPLSLLLIDVDDLRSANERHGYLAGDEVLLQVAAQAKGNTRRTDLVSRYGSDQFAVLLPETGLAEALQVAAKIHSAVARRPIALRPAAGRRSAPSVRATVSIGVAAFPKHSVSDDGLLTAADMALHMAKYSGKNRACQFNHVPGAAEAADPYQLYEFLQNSDWGALQALVAAVDARDRITGGHSKKVSRYAAALAEAIGLSQQDVEGVRIAALLHDVGKIGITDRVLVKDGDLTAEERKLIETHPSSGEALVRGSINRGSVLEGILYHHERYDGKGYPYGLAGDAIPIVARIIAIADAYDAMTSHRHYRTPPGRAKARMRLETGAGRQWDPDLARVFLRLEDAGCLDERLPEPSLAPAGRAD